MAAGGLYKHLPALDHAVPKLIVQYTSRAAFGLLICGLLPAEMSAIEGYLNSVATIFADYIYNGFFGRCASFRYTVQMVLERQEFRLSV